MSQNTMRGASISPFDLPKMERRLQAVYQPVEARPAFVTDLRKRLKEEEPKTAITPGQYMLWGGIGVLSSVLIVILGIRATRTLMDALGLLKHMRHPMPKDDSSPAPISSVV